MQDYHGSKEEKQPRLFTSVHTENCFLLGTNYTMKKTCFSCDASHFDESYASPGLNGKNHVFLPRGVEGKSKKLFFLQRHLWALPTLDQ